MSFGRCLLLVPLLLLGTIAFASADEGVRVANEGAIASWWRLADGDSIVAPGYPQASLTGRADVCLYPLVLQRVRKFANQAWVALDVVVKRWSNAPDAEAVAWEQFAKAASNALAQWRFAPAGDVVPKPTFTVATFTFMGGETAPPDLARHCRIADVRDAVLAARHDAYERGGLNEEWLDRMYRETMRREMRANQANRCSRSSGASCAN